MALIIEVGGKLFCSGYFHADSRVSLSFFADNYINCNGGEKAPNAWVAPQSSRRPGPTRIQIFYGEYLLYIEKTMPH